MYPISMDRALGASAEFPARAILWMGGKRTTEGERQWLERTQRNEVLWAESILRKYKKL